MLILYLPLPVILTLTSQNAGTIPFGTSSVSMYFLTSFELAALTRAFTAGLSLSGALTAITLAYGESLPSITMASFAGISLASTAKLVLMTDASTSGSVLGSCAASISFIFIFLGLSVMSLAVTSSPALTLISPFFSSSRSALEQFVESFGMAI